MLRRSVFAISITCALLIGTAIDAQVTDDTTDYVNELWMAAIAANPKIVTSERFYRAYAKMLLPHVHDFEGLIAVLRKAKPYACETNLLCRSGVQLIPGFRVGAEPTALDLIRFARESTCYGFLSDLETQTRFISDLERALRTSGGVRAIIPNELDQSGPDAHFLRYRLAKVRDSNDDLVFSRNHNTIRDYPNFAELLRRAGRKAGSQKPDVAPLDLMSEQLAHEACKASYGASVKQP